MEVMRLDLESSGLALPQSPAQTPTQEIQTIIFCDKVQGRRAVEEVSGPHKPGPPRAMAAGLPLAKLFPGFVELDHPGTCRLYWSIRGTPQISILRRSGIAPVG